MELHVSTDLSQTLQLKNWICGKKKKKSRSGSICRVKSRSFAKKKGSVSCVRMNISKEKCWCKYIKAL